MDLTNTNGQADTTWASRVKVSDRSFTINGLPWEHAVLLANTAGKHMWINVPHLADDTYIASLAQLLRDTLRKCCTRCWGWTVFCKSRVLCSHAQAPI